MIQIVDLHTQSTASDGQYSPSGLAELEFDCLTGQRRE